MLRLLLLGLLVLLWWNKNYENKNNWLCLVFSGGPTTAFSCRRARVTLTS